MVKRAISPSSVATIRQAKDWSNEAWTASTAAASEGSYLTVAAFVFSKSCLWSKVFSASVVVLAMMSTDSKGYLPPADSPESMTQSVPSKTAFATSEASALVGLGANYIDSSIWVAVTTGLPALLASSIMYFWAINTFSGGISIPRSPLATMIPSEAFKISS